MNDYKTEIEQYNYDELIQNGLDEIQAEWLEWANEDKEMIDAIISYDYDSEEEENENAI